MSVISLAELYEGVHYSRDPARARSVLADLLPASPSWAWTRRCAIASVVSAADSGSSSG